MLEGLFRDRRDAGRRLGAHLKKGPLGAGACVVLGIPRGGVVVAAEVARALGASLDVVVPRKIGAPREPELAIGAVALAGDEEIVLYDPPTIELLAVGAEYLKAEVERQAAEIRRRLAAYRAVRPPVPLAGVTAVLVDDGIATGLTARAAAEAVRRAGASSTVVAAPVAPAEALEAFGRFGLRLEVLWAPDWFGAVGRFYARFAPVEDDEVLALLRAEAGD